MSTNLKVLALASVAILALPAIGQADTIETSQWGNDGTMVPSGTSGVTMDGVDFTITSPSPSTGFTVYQQAGDWNGAFPAGALVLFDNFQTGSVVISFSKSISSLSLQFQADNTGAFTAEIVGYAGANQVGSVTGTGNGTAGIGGIAPVLTLAGAQFDKVEISTTNDANGFAFYGSPALIHIPEPASMTLLGSALVALGLRRRKRHQ